MVRKKWKKLLTGIMCTDVCFYAADTGQAAAGKNKGSVKIIGKGMKYGGSANVKFTIEKKSVCVL